MGSHPGIDRKRQKGKPTSSTLFHRIGRVGTPTLPLCELRAPTLGRDPLLATVATKQIEKLKKKYDSTIKNKKKRKCFNKKVKRQKTIENSNLHSSLASCGTLVGGVR
jgi:hypothetical protein